MLLPDDTQRLACVGKTGSGKTQAALWHLSLRGFDRMPWLIYDFKYDPLLNSIPGLIESDLGRAPQEPGIHIVHPMPDELDAVEAHLWMIWKQGETGVMVDEGYMMGNHNPAFNALLTQGRSKRIPMIVGSQRPTWITRFLFSEADFYQIFFLNDERDQGTVQSFIPYSMDKRLPNFHSYYYDVGADELTVLRPVPSREEILNSIAERLPQDEEISGTKNLRFV